MLLYCVYLCHNRLVRATVLRIVDLIQKFIQASNSPLPLNIFGTDKLPFNVIQVRGCTQMQRKSLRLRDLDGRESFTPPVDYPLIEAAGVKVEVNEASFLHLRFESENKFSFFSLLFRIRCHLQLHQS